jgi:D-alanyl-D-alanine endopeptidase (penicillin-binding protein 7)
MFSFLLAIALYFAKLPAVPAVQAAPPPAVALASTTRATGPSKIDSRRLGVVTTSRSTLIVDWETGASLFEKNADQPQAIASITKLVTALTVIGTDLDTDSVVEILAADMRTGGVSYLAPGDRLPLGDVLQVMLVASSNEAAAAAARATGLDEPAFAARMNETASRLGMTGSSFVEPTGLDARNTATARDVAFLVRAAMANKTIHDAVLQPSFTFRTEAGRSRAVRSTDDLLGGFLGQKPYEFLGGKTGFLDEAGYCFAAAAAKDGHRVIAVALGAPSKEQRFRDVKAMIFWAFDAYVWQRP